MHAERSPGQPGSNGEETQAVPLSIILAATHSWPEFGVSLNALYDQATAVGAEIIVADQTRHALPDDHETRFPGVVWIKKPDCSIFQLRALGLERSRGEIVAITEDHCRPAADWCARILEAHRKHPEAAMIGGGTDNGSRDEVISWASFLLGNAAVMTPVERRWQDKAALQINVSYKRPFIPAECPDYGFMEWMHNRDLQRKGEKLVADDSLLVEHVQPFDFHQACAAHFHAGRTVAGFRRQEMTAAERLGRMAACFAMPFLYYGRAALAACIKRRYIGQTAVCTPMMLVLAVCRSSGALAGYVNGCGASPMRLG